MELLTGLELTKEVGDHRTPGVYLSPPPWCWVYYHEPLRMDFIYLLIFKHGSRELNPSLHAYSERLTD